MLRVVTIEVTLKCFSSFPLCYEAEIGLLQPDERGVPLEHLVTWVHGVTLTSSPNGGCAKMLTWGVSANGSLPASSAASEDSSSSDMNERSTSPAQLAQQIALFGREVVELLRASPKCQLSFIKFIPAYHHHFGRQCRVANYGFTRLIDLLDALPAVVQASDSFAFYIYITFFIFCAVPGVTFCVLTEICVLF